MRKKGLRIAVMAMLLLLFGATSKNVAAAENAATAALNLGYSTVWENPFYENVTDVPETAVSDEQGAVPATGINEYSSVSSAANYIRKQMVARSTQIEFCYNGSDFTEAKLKGVMKSILSQACQVTSNPREGDYLYYHLFKVRQGFAYNSSRAYVVWQVTYMSNAAQENVMNQAIKSAVSALNLTTCSEVQKVKRIHDYICENTTYVNDGTNYCHSAHAALKAKAAVCQGYSTLFYAMCVQAGLEVRCIPGISSNQNHLWNIVKIGNKWYNVDTTWDSQINGVSYQYFLKNDKDFTNHTRSSGYKTTAFYSQHPMTGSSYVGAVGAVTLKSVRTISPTTAKLTWGKVGTATGYEIYCSSSKTGKYKKVKTISGGATTTWKATGLVPGTAYYYKIRAVSNLMGNSTSKYSTVKSVTPVPTKTKITKLSSSNNDLMTSWDKVTGAAGYELVLTYKSGNENISRKITVKSAKIRTAKISGLKEGKVYSVKVRAYAKGKNGKAVYGIYSAVKKKVVN